MENLGYAETYADYRPAKLRSGLAHPDCVVETASLSSVTPPDIHYNLTIPEEVSSFPHSFYFFYFYLLLFFIFWNLTLRVMNQRVLFAYSFFF